MKQLELFASCEGDNGSSYSRSVHWKLFIDGASRNNPGPSGAGIYILKDSKFFAEYGFYLGLRTNNQAEYYALLLGLFILKKYLGPDDCVHVISDSQLLINQLKGHYRIKAKELRPLFFLARDMLGNINAELFHVLRSDNKKADMMANRGIDAKKRVPTEFLTMLVRHGISW